MIPACFDSPEQYREWVAADEYSIKAGARRARDGYCTDCTPTYKARMIEARRCEFPKTQFVIRVEGDGVDITGVRRGG